MNNSDNELMRRFQALRQTNPNTPSQTAASSGHVSIREQPQQSRLQTQQLPVLQPLARSTSQATGQPPQQEVQKKTKKKCRGNRKRQRYRRQLYARGLNTDEVEKLIKEKFSSLHQHQPTQRPNMESTMAEHDIRNIEVCIPLERIPIPISNIHTNETSRDTSAKRKRDFLAPPPLTTTEPVTRARSRSTSTISKSISQLSISQGNPKKKKRTTNKKNNEQSMKSTEESQPHYLKVPDRIFKQLLAQAIDNGHQLVQGFDTKEKLYFIRQITTVKNTLSLKELQRQLWYEYYTLSTKVSNWESKTITKGYAHQHQTSRMYKPTKVFIQHRHSDTIPSK